MFCALSFWGRSGPFREKIKDERPSAAEGWPSGQTEGETKCSLKGRTAL